MTHRLWHVLMFGMLVLGIACSSSNTPKLGSENGSNSGAVVDIGNLLFEPAPWPASDDQGTANIDPIRIPLCLMTVLSKVDVPSKEEGTIAFIGTEIKDG